MSNDKLCLEAESLTKYYGGVRAVHDASLSVPVGARHAIIGPNGAGKTTLFNMIAGEIRPSSGHVLFKGKDVTGAPEYRRTQYGMGRVFQLTRLFPSLSVLQNLVLAVQGVRVEKYVAWRTVSQSDEITSLARERLRQVNLEGREHTEVRALSYGEQRQLEVGMALASHPTLLLLDEPAAGLASDEVTRMVAMLRRLPEEMTIIFIEHDMDVAFELAETISVLNQGEIVAEGSLDEIRANRLVQKIYLGEV